MPQTFLNRRRVEFADTDLAGFVHFSHYLRYMEETEYAFLRSLGLDVILDDERGKLGFPRYESLCRYLSPARYGQTVDVTLTVEKNDGKLITYGFGLKVGERPVAEGRLVVVCCRFPADREPFAIPVPDRVLDAIPLTD
ncbi:MAG TPA: thioesterase family protein [Pirellulaceae bacterium]|nr:thioesterase family protein [Pirellulaceae bacterium]